MSKKCRNTGVVCNRMQTCFQDGREVKKFVSAIRIMGSFYLIVGVCVCVSIKINSPCMNGELN